jgi:hypothetical protein
MKTRCLLLLMGLVVVGCTRSIAVVLPPQTLTVMLYDQGKVIQHCQVPPDSDKFRRLAELLRQRPSGWHKGFGSYAPTVLVEGPEVALNFSGDTVVMNYDNTQYAHSVSQDSYAFLACRPH